MKRLLALLASSMAAYGTNCVILDTLRNFDDTLYTGRIVITLNSPGSSQPLYTGSTSLTGWQRTLTVSSGVVSVTLVCNDSITPGGTSYKAAYSPAAGAPWSETWIAATGTTTVRAMRSTTVPSPTVMFAPSQLSGGGAIALQYLQYSGTSWGPVTLSALSDPTTTAGDVIYRAAGGLTRLGIGTLGHCMTAGASAPTWAACGGGGGSGTVTSVSVTSAGGVSGTVATATTTPAITLTLGAITPTSVVASGAVSGSNLSGTNTGDQATITGNAGTATALAANGANCSAGSFPLGVDAAGASETCTALPTTITGTANQITASAATGTITLSIPTSPTLPGTTTGTFSGALTGNVTGNVTGSAGSATGNAGTATALATARAINGTNFDGSAAITITASLPANPSPCAAGQYVSDIAADGTLTCAQIAFTQLSGSVTDAQVPDSITVTLAATATALAANGTNCTAGSYALGVDASGNSEGCTVASGGGGTVTSVSVTTANGVSGSVATSTTTPAITLTLAAITPTTIVASGAVSGSNLSGTNTGDQTTITGNAGTATALAANGANCSAGQFPLGVNASGAVETCTALPTTIAGTANQITASASTGAITLSIPTSPTLPGTTTGTFSGNLTGNVTGNASGSSGSTTGNAATATALAANPADCAANNFATTIAANGDLTCAQPSISAGVSGLAANVATALATPSSANLLAALTDETGTGAAVFATSPALTTPAITGLPTGSGVASAATASTLMSRDANANASANSFIYGYATTATAAGTTTLTVSSANQQFFTGTTTQTVTLPVTSTMVLGQRYVIQNNSTGVVTVQSSGANTVTALPTLTSATFTVILTSGTTAASWSSNYVAAGGGGISGSLTSGRITVGAGASSVQDYAALTYNGTKQTVTVNAIAATATDALILENTTAATAGVTSQISPSLRFKGAAWKTDSTAASQATEWQMFGGNVTGSNKPNNSLVMRPTTNGVVGQSMWMCLGPSYSNPILVFGGNEGQCDGNAGFIGIGNAAAGNVGALYSNASIHMLWNTNGLAVANNTSLFFNSGDLGNSVSGDVAIRRNAAGILEVNSGTSGALATIKVSDSHVFDSTATTGVTEGIFQAGQGQSTTPIIAVRGYHATLGTGALIFSFAGDAIPQWGTIAEPTCNSANRGKLVMVQGGAGVLDTFRICRKDAADAYAYVSLY